MRVIVINNGEMTCYDYVSYVSVYPGKKETRIEFSPNNAYDQTAKDRALSPGWHEHLIEYYLPAESLDEIQEAIINNEDIIINL